MFFKTKIIETEIENLSPPLKEHINSLNERIKQLQQNYTEALKNAAFFSDQIEDSDNFSNSLIAKLESLTSSIDSLPYGFLIHEKGLIRKVNKTLGDILGYEKQEVKGKAVFDFVHPEDRDIVRINMYKQESVSYRARLISKNNKIKTVLVHSVPIANSFENRVVHIQDITDFAQQEKELLTHKTIYEALKRSNTIASYILQGGQFLDVSMYLCEGTGYNEEELIKMGPLGFRDLILEEYNGIKYRNMVVREMFKKLTDNPTAKKQYEFPYRRKDGEIRWALLSSEKITYQGAPAIHALLIDITEIKKFEETLKDSEERFRLLSEYAIEGIMFHDKSGIIIANKAMLSMFGYEEDELQKLIGHDAIEFVLAEYQSDLLNKIKTNYELPFIVYCRRKDKTVFPVEMRCRRTIERGETYNIILAHDISDRERIEFVQNHDQNTGLLNRHGFKKTVHELIRLNRKFLLMNIKLNSEDITKALVLEDKFEKFREELVNGIVKKIKNNFFKKDILGRAGDTEFFLALLDIKDINEATKAISKINSFLWNSTICQKSMRKSALSIIQAILPGMNKKMKSTCWN